MAGSRHTRRLTASLPTARRRSAPCEGGRAMVAMMERETITPNTVLLDPDQKSPRAQEFEEKLAARIVGQERAVRRMSGLYQIFLAGMNPPNRPVGTMLFLGPTGSGKTGVVEAAAEVLFGDPNAVIKMDCAEFQHSHEIAKLINSPSAYLGNRDGEVLDDPKSFKTKEESKLSVLEYILQPEVYPQLYKDFSHVVRINYYLTTVPSSFRQRSRSVMA